MSTTRYEVPPGGGYYAGVPGIWQGGEVIEHDEATGEVTIISRPSEDQAAVPSAPAAETARAGAAPQSTPGRP